MAPRERAGVSRATVYQHFPSRLELVDAICDTPNTVRFWSSEDAILAQLYGATTVDPASRDLVERQLADRHGEMQRLARRLDESRGLRRGLDRAGAPQHLLVLTGYGSYRELREEGLSDAELTAMLQDMGRRVLLA
jgi:AcrR family transcriptional regulator